MRELKFRAWSKETRTLYSSDDIREFPLEHIKNGDVWTFEQYTGLKDKNGKEIYEGDIVEINGWWDAAGPAGYSKNLCAVEWDEEITGFEPFNNYDCDCSVYHYAEDCEVTGNIHENPERIRRKNEKTNPKTDV